MKKERISNNIYPDLVAEVKYAKGIKKLFLVFFPMHLIKPLITELLLFRVRLSKKKYLTMFQETKNALVNIGAGTSGKSGWINVDMFDFENINCIFDPRKYLPFPDNSAKGIFTEHFFEHIDYTEELPFFLSECYRVLQPGGVIRVIVPDFEKYIKAYINDGWQEIQQLRNMGCDNVDFYFNCKYNTKMELLNVVARQGSEHKFMYDYETLAFLLNRQGFVKTKKQEFGISYKSEICIDNPERAIESLYVEAVKPL